MARALITVPPNVRRGEVFSVRVLIAHAMETGLRADADGKTLPRDILRRFACRYNGRLVFQAELYPAIAANPYIAFTLLAAESGTLSFQWEGDNGFAQTETTVLNVTA